MSHQSQIEILKGQIRGLSRLLEEAIRLNQPHFRVAQYQRELHEAQVALRRLEEAWSGAYIPMPQVGGSRTGRIRGSQPMPHTVPRDLVIYGCKVVADPYAPDQYLYIRETHHPVVRRRSQGVSHFGDPFHWDRGEDVIERVTVPNMTYAFRETPPVDALLQGLSGLLRQVMAQTGHDIYPEIIVSPRNYAALAKLIEEQGLGDYAVAPPTQEFPGEKARFEDQLNLHFEELAKELAS